ncbi:hypothetical protein [Veronia pacifica]|nr:hypothetical protein [Veronia pacifica]
MSGMSALTLHKKVVVDVNVGSVAMVSVAALTQAATPLDTNGSH